MQRWGGFMETIYENYEQKDIGEKIQILSQKLQKLDQTKTLKEVKYALHFTEEEVNYLNSPLLDEIFETIFSETPIYLAIKLEKIKAFNFYLERSIVDYKIIESQACEKPSLSILRFLFENKKIIVTENHLLHVWNNKASYLSEMYGDFLPYDVLENFSEFINVYIEFVPKININFIKQIKNFRQYYTCADSIKIPANKIQHRNTAEEYIFETLYCKFSHNEEEFVSIKNLLERFENVLSEKIVNSFVVNMEYLFDINEKFILLLLKYIYASEFKKSITKEFLERILQIARDCNNTDFIKEIESNYILS